MSTITHTQPNNKKPTQQNGVSVLNSTNNTTPVQTPNTNGNMAPQQQEPSPSQSTSPPANNAPKYGTLVPNRVFVGGISANTTEVELAQLFSAYGNVKATKIISDRAGVSKGYGFVTFESEEEAKRLQRESENIMLRERRLNIAPAIKKQPFSRSFDVPSPPPSGPAPAHYYYASAPAGGVGYAYQNGMAYYTHTPPATGCASGEPGAGQAAAAAAAVYQAPPVYAATPTAAPPTAPYAMPLYPPQPLFVHQHQFPYQPLSYSGPSHFYGGGPPPQYVYRGAQQPPGSHISSNSTSGASVGTQTCNGSVSNSSSSSSMGTITGYPIGNGNGATTITSHSSCQPSAHPLPNTNLPPPQPSHTHVTINETSARYGSHAHTSYGCHPLTFATPSSMYYNMPMYAMDPAPGVYPESLGTTTPMPMQEPSHPLNMEQAAMAGNMMVRAASPPRSHSAAALAPQSTGAMPKLIQRPVTVQPQHGQQHYSQPGQPYMQYKYMMPNVDQQNGFTHPPPAKPQAVPAALPSQPIVHQPVADPKVTPVVSLLSVGQGNERDYRSMQGGRKCRPTKAHETSGNGIQPYRMTGQPVFAYTPVNGHQTANMRQGRRVERCESTMCRSWSKKRRNFNQTDAVSVRTHSNSSANANFDENLNERKDRAVDVRGEKRADIRGNIRDFLDNSRQRNQNAMNKSRSSFNLVDNSQAWDEARSHIRAQAMSSIQTPAVLGTSRRKRRNFPRRSSTIVRCVTPIETHPETDASGDSVVPCPIVEGIRDDLEDMGL